PQDRRIAMTPLLQTAGWTLIHFVWQGAAIALVMATALRLLRDRSANARYLIACVGLVAMLAAPALTARLIWTAPASTASTVSQFSIPPERAPAGTNTALAAQPRSIAAASSANGITTVAAGLASRLSVERLLSAIVLAWMIGVAILLVRMAGGWWHVRRLHRSALASSSSRWQTTCRRLAYRLGLPAAAHVVESALVDVPTGLGWLRPAVLLPLAAVASLSPAQVEAILAHELAHISRHDYAVNVLQTLVETLLFYHPAVWWLSNRIRIEREHCCDDVAVAICGDPVGYAQALA